MKSKKDNNLEFKDKKTFNTNINLNKEKEKKINTDEIKETDELNFKLDTDFLELDKDSDN